MPEYAALPDSTYAHHLLRMVELAPNLKSLAIYSRNILDLDELDFPPSLRLRSLFLIGVSISSRKLLSLVEQSRETIRYIDLTLVKLNSGKCHERLMPLCSLSRLLYFRTDDGGYSLTGASSHMAHQFIPDPECSEKIETLSRLDLLALGNLQRQVNANRVAAGFPQFREFYYRHIDQPSVESMMEALRLHG